MKRLFANRRSIVSGLIGVAILLAAFYQPALAQTKAAPIRLLPVRGVINPTVTRYVERNLSRTDARLYVLLLDTPGGSMESMRRVVQAILASPVPVVVYVAPQGARAGSAGMFIVMAGNVAAMAPATEIGAAHPVSALGEDIAGTMNDKVTNDAVALARSIAELRRRNADWAEEAVRNSLSASAKEAVERKVVDLMATNPNDLLTKLEGRRVTTAAGEVVLKLGGAPRETVPMTPFEQFLHLLVNPNVAYLLMLIGMLGIIIELFHPGGWIPGMVGAICLILAFIGLENLPLNWGGVALIVLALVLFVLDIKVAGFFLSIGGAIAFVLGSLILFSPLPFTPRSPLVPALRVNPALIAAMAAVILVFFVFVLAAGLRARRLPVLVGMQTVYGAHGFAVSDLGPLGVVQVQGEQWTAASDGPPIAAGEPVEVVAVEGNKLVVRRVEP